MNIYQQRLELLNPAKLLIRYRQALEGNGYQPNTIKREIVALEEFITWWQRTSMQPADFLNLALIDETILQAFQSYLTQAYEQRSQETIRRQLAQVVHLVEWATKERLIIPDASLQITEFHLTPELRDMLYTYQRYLEHQIRLQPVTVTTYMYDLKEFVGWWQIYYAPDWPFDLTRVDKTTIDAYKEYQIKYRQQAQSTVRRQIISIRRVLEWALDQQIITVNPTDENAVPYEAPITKVLSNEEVARLHSAIESDAAQSPFNLIRNRAIIALLLHTGLRTEELLNLLIEQIEVNEKAGILKNIGKASLKRNIPLNSYTRNALARFGYMLSRKNGPIFTTIRKGITKPLTARSIQHIVSHYSALAEIPDLTPTILRHTFGYHLAVSNVPVDQIAELMGYSGVARAQRFVELRQATSVAEPNSHRK